MRSRAAGSELDQVCCGIVLDRLVQHRREGAGWKIGQVLPATFVKTGKVPLKVGFIYKANTFGDYFISLKTYEKNFTDQLDFLILAKLKPGVSAELEGLAVRRTPDGALLHVLIVLNNDLPNDATSIRVSLEHFARVRSHGCA